MLTRKRFLFGVFCIAALFSVAAIVSSTVTENSTKAEGPEYLVMVENGTSLEAGSSVSPQCGMTIDSSEGSTEKKAKEDARIAEIELSVDKLAPKNVDPELKKTVVKAAYKAEVEKGVDGCITAAVIKQESNFNPNAIGQAREVGLMQIMGRYWYKHFGFKSRSEFEKALRDPEFNIMAGTDILKKCLDSKRGSYKGALKCYNGSGKYPPKIMSHYKRAGCGK